MDWSKQFIKWSIFVNKNVAMLKSYFKEDSGAYFVAKGKYVF